MTSVTLKVSAATRSRIKDLAIRSSKPMGRVVEEAVVCYERSIREAEYLAGWRRFQETDPAGFSEYMRESEAIERDLTDVIFE